MKRLCLLLTILCAGCNNPGVQEARLHGSLKGLQQKEVTMQYNGYTAEIYGNRDVKIVPGDEGAFETIVSLSGPGYFRLGQNTVYLSPGDDMEINSARQTGATTFVGTGSEANEYLKGLSWNDGGKLGLGWGQRLPFDVLLVKTDSLLQIRLGELAALQNVSDEFRRIEQARLNADMVNVYFGNIYGTEYYVWDDPLEVKREKEIAYYKSIFGKIELMLGKIDKDEKMLDVASVREVLLKAYNAGLEINVTPRLKELATVIEKAAEMDNGISRGGYDRFKEYGAKIGEQLMRDAYEAKLAERARLMEGQPAPDVTLRDVDGNALKLSDFKGDVLYVDFWATWCFPCLGQSPYFKELSGKYSQIRFVAISVDQNQESWLKKVQSEEHGAVEEYLTDAYEVGESWGVQVIPRFLLIDRDFNIITAFASRPADKETIEPLLESLSTH